MDATRLKALEQAAGVVPTASNIDRIGKTCGEEAARWAFTQVALRKRAKPKFSRSDLMLFDREGLEMASHEAVAAYHASLFPSGSLVVDLGCGIGSDLIALASRGPAIGYDDDLARVDLAKHNVEVNNQVAEVVVADALTVPPHAFMFADPARRSGGKRTLDPSEFRPDPFALADRFGGGNLLVMKLTSMLKDDDYRAIAGDRQFQLEFVSYGRECREALLLMGTQIQETCTYAVNVESRARLLQRVGEAVQDEPGDWVFEVDPAAIRAHCLGAFNLSQLGDSNGLLTGDEPVRSVWLRSYRVLYSGPADERKTNFAIGDVGGSTPEVKTRGVEVEAEQVRRKFKAKGSRPVCLFVYRVGKKLRHVLTDAPS